MYNNNDNNDFITSQNTTLRDEWASFCIPAVMRPDSDISKQMRVPVIVGQECVAQWRFRRDFVKESLKK